MRRARDVPARLAKRIPMCVNSQIEAKKERENRACWLRIDKLSCTLRT